MVTGGGTGGHIYPAIAIAEELLKREPASQLLYVGTEQGMEKKIVGEKNWPFATIKAKALVRGSVFKMFAGLACLPVSFWQARRLIKKFKPDIIIGTGGYVSFPLVRVGEGMGIKTFIHEQNAFPGMANRHLAKYADRVFLTFKEAATYLSERGNTRVTGFPVREEFIYTPQVLEKLPFDLSPDKFTLLVFGGSLGSEKINLAVKGLLEKYSVIPLQLIWVTGEKDYPEIKAELEKHQKWTVYKTDVKVFPFLHNISEAFSAADLAICRAGAGTISELQVMGLPAILIPYPYAAEAHQEKNARAMERQKGAIVIENRELTTERLYQTIESLRNSPERLQKMRDQMLKQARPFALRDIVDEILDTMQKES